MLAHQKSPRRRKAGDQHCPCPCSSPTPTSKTELLFPLSPCANPGHRKLGFVSLLSSKADQVGFLYVHHLVISFSCFKCSDSPSSFWPTITRAFFWIPHAMENRQELLKSLSQEATLLLWSDSLGLGNNMALFTSKFKTQVCDFFIIKKKKNLSTFSNTSKFWL